MPTDKLLHILAGAAIAAALLPFGVIPALLRSGGNLRISGCLCGGGRQRALGRTVDSSSFALRNLGHGTPDHSDKDPGAVAHGETEQSLMTWLRELNSQWHNTT
jgi:hypothetical protein